MGTSKLGSARAEQRDQLQQLELMDPRAKLGKIFEVIEFYTGTQIKEIS
jgi:hypothetical protein